MTEIETNNSIPQQLKRLRRKAESCRYAHGRIRTNAKKWRRMVEFIIAVLSLLLSIAGVILYRNIFPDYENITISSMAIVPSLLLFIQTVARIFKWSDKESQSEVAIHVWGQWIRESDFLEKNAHQFSEKELQNHMSDIDKKYIACMEKTPSIPENKFLQYKLDFKKYRLISKKIDDIDENNLTAAKKEIERIQKCCKN